MVFDCHPHPRLISSDLILLRLYHSIYANMMAPQWKLITVPETCQHLGTDAALGPI